HFGEQLGRTLDVVGLHPNIQRDEATVERPEQRRVLLASDRHVDSVRIEHRAHERRVGWARPATDAHPPPSFVARTYECVVDGLGAIPYPFAPRWRSRGHANRRRCARLLGPSGPSCGVRSRLTFRGQTERHRDQGYGGSNPSPPTLRGDGGTVNALGL